jgi:hypothetical protein
MHKLKRTPEWINLTSDRIDIALMDSSINGWEMCFLTDIKRTLSAGKGITDKQERRLVEVLVKARAWNCRRI